jgi:hypothetical protein
LAAHRKTNLKAPANLLGIGKLTIVVKFRRFMRWCFGFASIAFSLLPALAILVSIAYFLIRSELLITPRDSVVFAILLGFSALHGMAWWTLKKGKSSGRGWAIAASASMLLLGVPLFFASYSILFAPYSILRHGSHFPIGLLIFNGLVPAIGIAGLAAFLPRTAVDPADPPMPPRIPGDGTSRLGDGFAFLFGIVGAVLGMRFWEDWGFAVGLPRPSLILTYIQIGAAALIAIAAHECGHAVVALALGMKLRAFIVGPFHWRIRDGKWKFEFQPARLLSFGGAAGAVPSNPEQPLWHRICVSAGGPLASLYAGLIAVWFALMAKGRPYEQFWNLLALIATFSLLGFAVNVIPFRFSARNDAAYSDGAKIYQFLQGGPWADLHRVFSIAGSSAVTPLRPRDFDIQAIQRTARSFTSGRQGLTLRLFASYYFLDRDMIPETCGALAEAESVYLESASDISAELHTDFVFGNALLRRDAAKALQWWERMEGKKPTHFGVDYWLAQSALRWIESRPLEAYEAWNKGNILAQQLPAAGIYEFDRYRCSLLRQVLDEAPAAN